MNEPPGRRPVAVVGGRGFLGRAIRTELTRAGYPVRTLDRDNPALRPTGLAAEIVGADTVVWAASSINPMISANDPDRVEADIDSFRSFVTAITALDPAPRIILLSSGGTVYDQTASPPFSESSPAVPATEYGRAKLALEHQIASAERALVLRIANAYGPRQPVAPGQGVIAHWMAAIHSGHTPHLYGDPGVARDYVYVGDIAEAVLAAIETKTWSDRTLNIGSGVPTSLGSLYTLVQEVTGTDTKPQLHPSRGFDVRSTWLDCGRAMATIGWRAETPLRNGLASTWHHVVATSTAV